MVGNNDERCDPINHDERWLRTRSEVNYQELSRSDDSDTETLDDTMSTEDEEQDIEIMREDNEEVSDSLADDAYGLDDRSPDDSNSVFTVTGSELEEGYNCDVCESNIKDALNLDSHHGRYHGRIKAKGSNCNGVEYVSDEICYECDLCNVTFEDEFLLKEHVNR